MYLSHFFPIMMELFSKAPGLTEKQWSNDSNLAGFGKWMALDGATAVNVQVMIVDMVPKAIPCMQKILRERLENQIATFT